MKPCLVITGGTGFVGRNLLPLIPSEYEIKLIVAGGRKFESNKFTTITPSELSKEVWAENTQVLHMAVARGTKSASFKRKLEIDFTLKLAQKAISQGVASFVFLSCFANKNHTEVELGLVELFKGADTRLIILKLPILYGPYCRGPMRFLFQTAKKGRGLPLQGVDLPHYRLFVGNLIQSILIAFKKADLSGVYKVTDSIPVSLKDFYQQAMEELSPEEKPFWPIGGQIVHFVANIIKKLLQWVRLERAASLLEAFWLPQDLSGQDFFSALTLKPKWDHVSSIKITAKWFAKMEEELES
ncbi:MAG: hypothetical protein QNL04_07370 [SAR324 cluster bacterium]|nr:hypothetical protein [SAR324 cluster bacterium]